MFTVALRDSKAVLRRTPSIDFLVLIAGGTVL